MARKPGLALIAQTPVDPGLEASKFVSEENLAHLAFWKKLQPKEQAALVADTQQLAGAMIAGVASKLAQGQYLKRIQETLLPYEGAFTRYLRSLRYLSTSTAYRYIAAFENIQERLPKAVLHAAIVRGMDILSYDPKRPLGSYTDVFRLLPPPTNPSPTAAAKYLDQLEQTKKEQLASRGAKKRTEAVTVSLDPIKADPRFLQINSFRNVKNNLLRVPARKRKQWLATLIGTILTQAGYSSPVTFEPEAIPDEFNQGRGRPRLVSDVVEGVGELQEAVG